MITLISKEVAEALYMKYYSDLYRLALMLLTSKPLAEDVVSEAFLKAFSKYAQYDPSRDIKPWLTKILINEARQANRKITRSREVSGDFEHILATDSFVQGMLIDERNQALWQLVELLRPKLREIIVLHYYESMTLPEIARLLFIPLGTCKSRLNAALKQLKSSAPGLIESIEV